MKDGKRKRYGGSFRFQKKVNHQVGHREQSDQHKSARTRLNKGRKNEGAERTGPLCHETTRM